MATIRDIAKISGYSIGTVSRVINNRADVSPEAREIIEKVIQEQNFQPNANAKLLKQTVSSEISIIVRGVGNRFLETVLENIQIRMREHGESINVQFIQETANEIETAVQLSQQTKPVGFIFLGGSVDHFREAFSQISAPSVLVTVDAEELGFANLSSFTTDDAEAAACAVRKLAEAGHRHIGILGGYTGPSGEGISSKRLEGALAAMTEAGIVFDPGKDYEPCPFSAEGGYRAAKALLARDPELTGLFALSDSVAMGTFRAAADMRLKVPEDISLIGFDGIDDGSYTVPRLSTIRQDAALLAGRSVDDLLLRISYKRQAIHEIIPYKFVDGESVTQPRRI